MRFVLVDRISEFEPGKRIVAHKALTLAEEYLADHFPAFPVLPGVLMLEAMVQASAWLARQALDFSASIIVLKEAKNVTYKSFVAPGQVLTIESLVKEFTPTQSTYTASGQVQGRAMVKGQLTLAHRQLADSGADLAEIDQRIRAQQRKLFSLVWSGTAQGAAPPVG